MSEFTCKTCRKTFQKITESFDEAKEFLENFPECKKDSTSLVCDTCYLKFMEWFSTLTEEEKQDIRNVK